MGCSPVERFSADDIDTALTGISPLYDPNGRIYSLIYPNSRNQLFADIQHIDGDMCVDEYWLDDAGMQRILVRYNANTIRKEINEIRDKLERKAKQFMAERERLRKSRKAQIKSKPNAPVNALLMNPLKTPDLPIISQTAPAYAPSPLTALINGSDSMRDAEIVSLLDRMKELDDLHEAALKELDDVIDKRGKFLYMIVHRGYLTSDFVNEYFPEELHEAMLKPIPVP